MRPHRTNWFIKLLGTKFGLLIIIFLVFGLLGLIGLAVKSQLQGSTDPQLVARKDYSLSKGSAGPQSASVKVDLPPPGTKHKSKTVLVVTPVVFNLTPGATQYITISSANSQAIAAPQLVSDTSGSTISFTDQTSKKDWNGKLTVSAAAAPGTYTLNFTAQDAAHNTYKGSTVLNVVTSAPTL